MFGYIAAPAGTGGPEASSVAVRLVRQGLEPRPVRDLPGLARVAAKGQGCRWQPMRGRSRPSDCCTRQNHAPS